MAVLALCVTAYGAAAKGSTLLNYFGIGTGLIECLVEKNELRRGLYSTASHYYRNDLS